VAEIRPQLAPHTPVEIWFQDEMRVGQKNKLTYRWARKGSRPVPPTIKGPNRPTCSVRSEPEPGAGAALVLPACNTEAMQLHLDEIATKIAPGAHDRRPWRHRLCRAVAAARRAAQSGHVA
jgi:putative transposase